MSRGASLEVHNSIGSLQVAASMLKYILKGTYRVVMGD